jgi:hypothetical protein
VIVVLLAVLWAVTLWPRYDHTDTRKVCAQQQKLWDGQTATVEYVATEITGSPVQTQLAVEGLREQLGPRPVCKGDP